uniref:Leucine-rich repeat-containing N-terminal plant-type domain-containing protein n=1 Tax=Oryza barthii TaxID=65489 RepID=A0A0D3F0X9_9ORYZ
MVAGAHELTNLAGVDDWEGFQLLLVAASHNYLLIAADAIDDDVGKTCIKLLNTVILDFGWNNFICDIPGSIGQLKRLEELHLDYTSMSGELPLALGNCTSLKTISIKHNNCIGDIPGSIGQLKRLEKHHLGYT